MLSRKSSFNSPDFPSRGICLCVTTIKGGLMYFQVMSIWTTFVYHLRSYFHKGTNLDGIIENYKMFSPKYIFASVQQNVTYTQIEGRKPEVLVNSIPKEIGLLLTKLYKIEVFRENTTTRLN